MSEQQKQPVQIGDRVGAIASFKEGKLEFFGFGTYEGSTIPETDDVTMWGALLKEVGIPTPTILLESGEKVYGCECWWGNVDSIQKYIDASTEIVNITPAEYRQKAKQEIENPKS